jgi:hypothetical protein
MNERLTTRSDYAMRLERVFRWLADHLDDTLDLARLAEVAAMSPYHFHRTYHAMQGETAAETVRRRRLHRAASSPSPANCRFRASRDEQATAARRRSCEPSRRRMVSRRRAIVRRSFHHSHQAGLTSLRSSSYGGPP